MHFVLHRENAAHGSAAIVTYFPRYFGAATDIFLSHRDKKCCGAAANPDWHAFASVGMRSRKFASVRTRSRTFAFATERLLAFFANVFR